LLGIGKTYYSAQDYPKALETLRDLVANYPNSPHLPEANIVLAQTYTALTRHHEAADAYAQYLDLNPGLIDSYVYEWRGDSLASAGEYQTAIEAYQSALGNLRVGETIDVEIKIGRNYSAMGDYSTAIVIYRDVYTRTLNDYTKAQADYLMGQAYMALNQSDQAYASYLDAVENYPLSNDSYQALILLVNAGYPVSEFDRGLVDYHAGQYNLAIAAFDRYLSVGGEHSGTALYYKGLAYLALDSPQNAIDSWDELIQNHPDNPYWDEGWEEKAFTLWAYLDQYGEADQILQDFVEEVPWHPRAPEFLFDAARVLERAGDLNGAAMVWDRLPAEYPNHDLVSRSLFLGGVSRYRLGNYEEALTSFLKFLGNAVPLGERAAAQFWIGKVHQLLGDTVSARAAWSQAVNLDPTGYYSERARDLLLSRSPYTPPLNYDLGFDASAERVEAERWIRTTFGISDTVNLSGLGELSTDSRLVRGTELWNLGYYDAARLEFEDLRQEVSDDPASTYRLANYLVKIGLYRSGVFAARQVLNLAGMDDAATMNAPIYFNHLRFGSYYRDLIIPVAEAYDFHPLFLFTVVRQESLFEGFVRSSKGARGLMQIIPSTGASIATQAGWPPDYSADDLYRPKVSLTFGADYLDDQRDFFCDGAAEPLGACLYAGLAAYNAGPGNAAIWYQLAGEDPDLFLEVIRFEETRRYLRGIYEVFTIYRRLYDRTP
jgi:soluble lytic murein transglycosylase